MYKLVGAMRERNLSNDDLFRMIDISNDQLIQLDEMVDVVKILNDFKKKELHALHQAFDLDNNGVVDKDEFDSTMRRFNTKYDKWIKS